jgi:hypothetical protein
MGGSHIKVLFNSRDSGESHDHIHISLPNGNNDYVKVIPISEYIIREYR